MFVRHLIERAFSRAALNAGKRIAISMAIIAITTSSSTSVKALSDFEISRIITLPLCFVANSTTGVGQSIRHSSKSTAYAVMVALTVSDQGPFSLSLLTHLSM